MDNLHDDMDLSKQQPSNTEETNNKDEASTQFSYWRGFKELYGDPEFEELKRLEFSDEAEQRPDIDKMSLVSRRKFLALMSASAALAAAGCANYRDKGEVIRYNKQPEEVTLGLPYYYATTCTGCSSTCGLLVKTREGRPIKIDGNPDHPVNKGKICTKGQAGIINLYDPGRLREPQFSQSRKDFTAISWKDVDTKIMQELKSSGSKQIVIVTHSILSPTQKKLLDDFKVAFPSAKVYSYEVFNDTPRKDAWFMSYGKKSLPVIQWDKPNVILALESDFLGNEGNQMEQTRLYAERRDVMGKNEFNKLYAVEGAMTLTGLNADYRIRLRTDAIEEFVLCLLNEFLLKRKISDYAADTRLTAFLVPYSLDDFIKQNNLPKNAVNSLVDDLAKNQGLSYVSAGDKLPESTHISVNLLNDVLGNGKVFSQDSEKIEIAELSTLADMENLLSDMNLGKISVLIHFDTNPVFHFSPDYEYSKALAKVPTVITLAENVNETASASNFILPINDPLECWGDFKTRTGFYSTQQPLIAPLFNTRQKESILLTWMTGKDYSEKVYHEYLIDNWQKNIYPTLNTKTDFNQGWYSILHDGVAFLGEKLSAPVAQASIKDVFISSAGKLKVSTDYVILLQNNNTIGDGRFANNGWLQELPHPVSKMVWDNYAAVSVQTAAALGVNTNDLIEITNGPRKQNVPVFIQPGVAEKVIELTLGYGRGDAGVVGSGVGVNVNVLLAKNSPLTARFYNGVKVNKTSGNYELITTQEYDPIDENPLLKDIQFKRKIINEGTYDQYKKNPKFLQEEKEKLNLAPINRTHKYESYKWGMAIDLNKCTGCEACVTACNVENNIAVAGKDQAKMHRVMHWIRLDRYYYGTPDAPKTSFQPMLCQQCDFAPCENVCPVAATTHTTDGLNSMTFNRCVGTRYCSNNCPYKVRRFNYFNFRDHFRDAYYLQEPTELVYNPEVTVRWRGVMEKCTFCVQRIMQERQTAIEEKRDVKGDNVTTACQDSCPAYAIKFGDINNNDSTVSKYRAHELGYFVLEELKVAPNVTYIAKLRNIKEEFNPEKPN